MTWLAQAGSVAWARTNVATAAQARRLVDAALRERLAACANWHAIESAYWWKGGRRRAKEVAITFRTSPARLRALVERVRALHPYEVPYLAWGTHEQTARAYARWVKAESAPRKGRPPRARPRT